MPADEPPFVCIECGGGGSICRGDDMWPTRCRVCSGTGRVATGPPSISAPIDDLHAMCVEARESIRMHTRILQAHAAQWQPRPCPARLTPPERNE